MDVSKLPLWLEGLDSSEISFIKKFILTSGSLKEMAREYSVTYPTVRLKLDRLIQKIELSDKKDEDTYLELIKNLTVEGKIEPSAAQALISEYKKQAKEHR